MCAVAAAWPAARAAAWAAPADVRAAAWAATADRMTVPVATSPRAQGVHDKKVEGLAVRGYERALIDRYLG